MMNLIHLVMFGFIVGAGLCMLHYLGQRLLAPHDIECPWKQAKHTAARAARLGGLGLGAYLLASVGWAVLPAAAAGFLVTRPALVPARSNPDRSSP